MLDDLLLSKLAHVEARFDELTGKLSDPEVLARPQGMQKLAKEHADLRELTDTLRQHRELGKRVDDARDMQTDPEMRDLPRQDETRLAGEPTDPADGLKLLLLPKHPHHDYNILL